jgi:HD-like signal output (HDOD) protein
MTENILWDRIITSSDYLPIDSRISKEVFNIIHNKKLTARELIEIINKDQSIVSRIIAIANSPGYGFSKKISTLEMAISILGLDAVKDLVIGFSIINSTYNDNDRYFISDAFNKHSYLCGYISMLLANDFNYPVKNECFVAGLVHDIGIPIIHKYLNNEFKLISELKFYRKINQTKAERLILGKTHCDIGATVAEKWNFPEQLIDAIQFHHNPTECKENQKLAAIVHLADFIASKEAPQFLMVSEDEQLDKSIMKILGIPDESFLFDVVNNISDLIRTINII